MSSQPAPGLSRRTFLAGVGGTLAAVPLLSACGSSGGGGSSNGTVDLSFLYPVGVSGPLAKVMQSLVDDFNKSHPKIHVKPSFTGDYVTNLTKILTTVKGGNPPDVAIFTIGDQQSLLDLKALQPIDQLAKKNSVDVQFDDFYPSLLNETKSGGATYGLPFQRSTPVLYYNADALSAVGVSAAPSTWDDVVAGSHKLMSANKVQWGVEFPTAIWQYQGLVLEAGQDLTGSDLSHVAFDTPAAVTALSWLVDLGSNFKISPKGTIDPVSSPAAFSGGKVGFLYNSSGSLTSILQQSKFKVGTAVMPKKEKFGAPTGGGNLYIFKNIPAARQRAALTFIKWMTEAAQAAKWSIATGYVPSRKAVIETADWKAHSAKTPQVTTAIDQLAYAVPSLNSHATSQISATLLAAMQTAVAGQSSASKALGDAQKKADSVLAQYR